MAIAGQEALPWPSCASLGTGGQSSLSHHTDISLWGPPHKSSPLIHPIDLPLGGLSSPPYSLPTIVTLSNLVLWTFMSQEAFPFSKKKKKSNAFLETKSLELPND